MVSHTPISGDAEAFGASQDQAGCREERTAEPLRQAGRMRPHALSTALNREILKTLETRPRQLISVHIMNVPLLGDGGPTLCPWCCPRRRPWAWLATMTKPTQLRAGEISLARLQQGLEGATPSFDLIHWRMLGDTDTGRVVTRDTRPYRNHGMGRWERCNFCLLYTSPSPRD